MAEASFNVRRNTCADHTDLLVRDAGRLLDACGVTRSRQWISRTVRAYLDAPAQEQPFGLYLAARVEMNNDQRQLLAECEDLRYVLTYADPTGQTAMSRVMRAAS